jgi:hypothetical protein
MYVSIMALCNISQIATGMPYSESPRTIFQSGPILIKIGCNLTCFGPVQSFYIVGWGTTPYSPWGALLTHSEQENAHRSETGPYPSDLDEMGCRTNVKTCPEVPVMVPRLAKAKWKSL